MLRSRRRLAGLVLVLVALAAAPAGGQPAPPDPVDPGALEPTGGAPVADGQVVTGSKATSRPRAETDAARLARTDGEAVEVMIKLDTRRRPGTRAPPA